MLEQPEAINPADLPNFDRINAETASIQIKEILKNNSQKLHTLLQNPGPFTWENLLQPLDEMADQLNKTWSSFSHLHAVMESESLRSAYNELLPLLTEYSTEMAQNVELFNAISSLANSDHYSQLDTAQKKIIENDLRDFKLAGNHLSPEKKAKMAILEQELSQLTTKFSENIMDATLAFTLHIIDEQDLAGLPQQALQLAKDNAMQRKLDGWVFTLDYPSYSTAVKYLDKREIRKTLYEAYSTRASDQGPNAGKWDNAGLIDSILQHRHELALLVGFENYASYSLATKMAKSPTEVLKFLQDLLARSRALAQQEAEALAKLARQMHGIDELQVWDTAYYSEKLREAKFNFNQEDIRPYFPIDNVLNGLFSIVQKIYGLKIQEETNISVWNPEVKFFSLHDEDNNLRGGFYIDLYARPHKRDGAWMDDCRVRRRLVNHKIQQPIAYLTCNFMRAVDGKPALLTHDDVNTLFHEFGHCLHHMLTKVDYPAVSGINGVPWDAVEFPSQFMENFVWEKESLALIAKHVDTGEPLPDSLYQKMLAAKHFQTGLQMVRQLEFALFDFRLHLEFDPTKKQQVRAILLDVRKETSVIPVPSFNRFENSFSHIFAGGYAAGYYSYKWAEVLSCDAYAQFTEQGIFNPNTGRSFMQNILEVGGVRDPMTSFIAFRGRAPTIDALLKQSGI